MYLVIWRLPESPTPIQRLVSSIDQADVGELSALAHLAFEARLEADLADEHGIHAGRVRSDMSVSLMGGVP